VPINAASLDHRAGVNCSEAADHAETADCCPSCVSTVCLRSVDYLLMPVGHAWSSQCQPTRPGTLAVCPSVRWVSASVAVTRRWWIALPFTNSIHYTAYSSTRHELSSCRRQRRTPLGPITDSDTSLHFCRVNNQTNSLRVAAVDAEVRPTFARCALYRRLKLTTQESPAVARKDALQPIGLLLLLQYWSSCSCKFSDFHVIWMGVCHFPLVIISNLGPISLTVSEIYGHL